MATASLFQRAYIHRTYKKLLPLIRHKKTASYFTIALSLFSLSFFGLFAIRPTLITAVSLIKSVSDLKKLNSEYENKISSIIRAQSEYEQIRDALPLINAALPANPSFSKLAKKIEEFAQKSEVVINQLRIDGVSISNLPPGNKMEKFDFSLIASGNYPAISSFLGHLINWKRIISINSLEFSQEGGTTSGNLRLIFKGGTYYEP